MYIYVYMYVCIYIYTHTHINEVAHLPAGCHEATEMVTTTCSS